MLAIGAILIALFPGHLPVQSHSPSELCALDENPPLGSEQPTNGEPYFWSQQKGTPSKSGGSGYLTPNCLSRQPTWKWVDPLGAVLRATPLVDDKKSIYISTIDGRVIKFDQSGATSWMHESTWGQLPSVPAISNGRLFQTAALGYVFALDMETGQEVWATRVANATCGDSHSILAVDGIIVSATDCDRFASSNMVVALDEDGAHKWTYRMKDGFKVYNFQASSPGDGTIIFMDSSGGVYRLQLASGDVVWESGISERKPGSTFGLYQWIFQWFSTGAAVIGPDNNVYCASNYGFYGIFHAYRLEDGKPLWRTNTTLVANTGLAVGRLAGSSELAVVAGVGNNGGLPVGLKLWFVLYACGPFILCLCSCFLFCYWWKQGQPIRKFVLLWVLLVVFLVVACAEIAFGANALASYFKDTPRWLFLSQDYSAMVVALNAKDGSQRWTYEPPKYSRPQAAGDEERLLRRMWMGKGDIICLPDSFNQGVINGFGTVFIGHQDGRMYAIGDTNGDGHIQSDTEASYYTFGDAFQASVGLAPGIVAVVPCGGGLFVWKS